MSNLRTTLLAAGTLLTFGAFATFAAVATAQPAPAAVTVPAPATASSPPAAADLADGEVRKIDQENKKLTLRHSPLANLDMPGMTMVFHVADAAMLDNLKVGDKVRFKAEKADGKLTVTQMEAAR